jgi:hypothetical protein
METLRDQLVEIVKKAKILKEDVSEDEDRTLGTIDKYLDESVSKKVGEVLDN